MGFKGGRRSERDWRRKRNDHISELMPGHQGVQMDSEGNIFVLLRNGELQGRKDEREGLEAEEEGSHLGVAAWPPRDANGL